MDIDNNSKKIFLEGIKDLKKYGWFSMDDDLFSINIDERIELKGINFAFDKYNLDQKSLNILAQALKVVQARPVTDKMVVEGWTDWTGSDAYNLRLSQRRAQAVKSYLVEHGIAADRISISGEGKSFKYNNHTPEGRYANRRAEIIFVKENAK